MMDAQTASISAQHIVTVNGVVHSELLDVEWYDTATPYLGCVRELQRLCDLAAATPFEIVSYGQSHKIANQRDFLHWVAEVFERGLAFGFSKRLKVE